MAGARISPSHSTVVGGQSRTTPQERRDRPFPESNLQSRDRGADSLVYRWLLRSVPCRHVAPRSPRQGRDPGRAQQVRSTALRGGSRRGGRSPAAPPGWAGDGSLVSVPDRTQPVYLGWREAEEDDALGHEGPTKCNIALARGAETSQETSSRSSAPVAFSFPPQAARPLIQKTHVNPDAPPHAKKHAAA